MMPDAADVALYEQEHDLLTDVPAVQLALL